MTDEDRTSAVIRRLLEEATDVETITRDHPVLGPLADIIEDQLIVEILGGTFGVDIDEVDRDRLSLAALAIADQVHHVYDLRRRTSKR